MVIGGTTEVIYNGCKKQKYLKRTIKLCNSVKTLVVIKGSYIRYLIRVSN